MVNEAGEAGCEELLVVRDDFWASASNERLNVPQHIETLLTIGGRAAVVPPDNVLFEELEAALAQFSELAASLPVDPGDGEPGSG